MGLQKKVLIFFATYLGCILKHLLSGGLFILKEIVPIKSVIEALSPIIKSLYLQGFVSLRSEKF